ncbi:Peptidyl-prolyl cis-trans isomerase CYP18-1 [Bienertia sinuspersici]
MVWAGVGGLGRASGLDSGGLGWASGPDRDGLGWASGLDRGGLGWASEGSFPAFLTNNWGEELILLYLISFLQHNARGIMSMANSGANTNGSQFFMTYAKQPHLNGLYTVFGKAIHGFEVLDHMEKVQLVSSIRPYHCIRTRQLLPRLKRTRIIKT